MKRFWPIALAGVVVVAAFLAGIGYGRGGASVPGADAGGHQILHYMCPMHPQYTRDGPGDCPQCGMRLEPVYAEGASPSSAAGTNAPAALPGTVRVTPEKQQAIGVQLGTAERRPEKRVLRTVGRVAADETRIYRLTAATTGWFEKAYPNSVGSLVRKDEALATFYAREFLGAQQAYLYALDARDRFLQQNATEAQMAATNIQVQSAIDTLIGLGMSRVQIDELAKTRQRTNTIDLRSPVTGFVLTRNISQGQRFEPGDELYVVADLSEVWVLADLFEHERRYVEADKTARVLYQGETFKARASAVLPTFDTEARTMKMRLELDNPGYRFRPGMFVDVEFPIELPEALTVPADAIVDSGLRKTVFVDRGDGYFEPRTVETGWRMGDRVEILKGLMDGERIVIAGTFLVDSESRMKAAAMGIYTSAAKDPVCGMDVDEKKASAAGRTSVHQGTTYYFCSDQCKKDFDKDPAKFAAAAATKARAAAPAASTLVEDPICGMQVDPAEARKAGRVSDYGGRAYYFCADSCKEEFDRNPRKYVTAGTRAPR